MGSGETLDSPVLDHVFIGKTSNFSFKEKSET